MHISEFKRIIFKEPINKFKIRDMKVEVFILIIEKTIFRNAVVEIKDDS